jgi:transposase InsO family protein
VSDERLRFVVLASAGERSIAQLCREFGISRQCGYTWLKRYRGGGASEVLVERSRRPVHSPARTDTETTAAITALRLRWPDWGASKLRHVLIRQHPELNGVSRSTVHRILLREGMIRERDQHPPCTARFERNAPNELWQMDFKGPKGFRQRSGPLSVLDDHSRYLLTLEHLESGRIDAVQPCLQRTFEQNGLPEAMLMDHGTPWWNANSPWGWTELSVWLMRQGIRLYFSGYRHPQTQGKVERMHQALHAAIRKRKADADEQSWLDIFRQEYNWLRPHEALGMQTPVSRWQPSGRAYQPKPGNWEYPARQNVIRLNPKGEIVWAAQRWNISLALKNQLVGVEQTGHRALVYYCNTPVLELNLKTANTAALPVDPFRSIPTQEINPSLRKCQGSPATELSTIS